MTFETGRFLASAASKERDDVTDTSMPSADAATRATTSNFIMMLGSNYSNGPTMLMYLQALESHALM